MRLLVTVVSMRASRSICRIYRRWIRTNRVGSSPFSEVGQRLLLQQAQLAGLHGDVVVLRFDVVDPADWDDMDPGLVTNQYPLNRVAATAAPRGDDLAN